MSVDYCPTCPDCGDDLVYQPEPALTERNNKQFKRAMLLALIMKEGAEISTPHFEEGDWQCPDCKKWFDIPEGPLPEPEPE